MWLHPMRLVQGSTSCQVTVGCNLIPMRIGPLLFVLFTAVPIIEIVLFIVVGQRIGIGATIAIILLTAMLGSLLVARQGRAKWGAVMTSFQRGEFPGVHLVDGAMILVAGALLLTPGFLTDAIGFLLLMPPVRGVLRRTGARYAGRRVHIL